MVVKMDELTRIKSKIHSRIIIIRSEMNPNSLTDYEEKAIQIKELGWVLDLIGD